MALLQGGASPTDDSIGDLLARHYSPLSAAVLGLAAFNLFFRLTSEAVSEWDESLYATSAWEMWNGGDLVATTINGQLDYYNSKPPLTVWLIAAAFKFLGVGLFSLRLPSALSAWLTVLVLIWWTRARIGPAVSIVSGVILSTAFGFINVHSGRSATPDALMTLLFVLTAVTLVAAQERPERRVWLGPLAAGVFLLKGPGVLMLLVFIALAELWAARERPYSWRPAALAVALFTGLVGAWATARWSVDGMAFFRAMFVNDLIALSANALDGNVGGPLYYLDILQRYQYDWLAAGLVAVVVSWPIWRSWAPGRLAALRAREPLAVVIAAWMLVTLLVPTALQTKVSWYLDPFYPVFAVGMASLLVAALSYAAGCGRGWRIRTVVGVTVVALGVAEGKSLWESTVLRRLDASPQGLLLTHRGSPGTTRVYRDSRHQDEAFVAAALMQSEDQVVETVDAVVTDGRPGDLFLSTGDVEHDRLTLLGRAKGRSLYRLR